MKRREFIAALGGAATALPFAATAQQRTSLRRIGFLTPRAHPVPPAHDAFSDAFVDGMNRLGYAEGKNLVVEWRYADGDYARLADLAKELVAMNRQSS